MAADLLRSHGYTGIQCLCLLLFWDSDRESNSFDPPPLTLYNVFLLKFAKFTEFTGAPVLGLFNLIYFMLCIVLRPIWAP